MSSPHLQVFENGSLNILDARESDQGHYMCQASNGVGAGLSKVIKVTIHGESCFCLLSCGVLCGRLASAREGRYHFQGRRARGCGSTLKIIRHFGVAAVLAEGSC